MKKTFNVKTLVKILLIVASIGVLWYVSYNFTFNFVALFFFLLVFMTLPLWLEERPKRVVVNPQTKQQWVDYQRNINGRPVYNSAVSRIYAFAVLVFGCLTLYALGNYFNAHNNVYYNFDHHALRIDGVKVRNGEDFVLASTRRDAFLDTPTINGEVVIEGYDSAGVHLSLNGLTTPIYMKEYDSDSKEPVGYRCDHMLAASFNDSERVEIITRNDNSSELSSLSFKITANHEDGVLWGLVKHPDDAIECEFVEGQFTDTSSFTTFLKSGYSLMGMSSDVPLKTDLSGINIVRNNVALKCKRREVYDKYKDRPYFVELENGHSVHMIKVYGEDGVKEINVSELDSDEKELTIKYNKPFYLGSGSNKSESVYFALSDDGSLHVRYELPKYQRLTSSDGSLESTVMVTSTLINPDADADGDSGLIENLTDNVLLYDVFHNYNNSFNIVPFYLSYIGGPTNERMQFVVMSPSADAFPCLAMTDDEPAYFPGVKSHNGTEWLVQMEDFKSTSPFYSTKLAWILLICIFLCAGSLVLSGQGRLYTGVEYAVYLLLIAFLSVRFFLMWRVTVFPPLTSISWYEFEHFRDPRWLNIVYISLGVFFVAITLVKMLLGSLRKEKLTIQDWIYRNRRWMIVLAVTVFCVGLGLIFDWRTATVAAVLIAGITITIRKLFPGLPPKLVAGLRTTAGMFTLITAVAIIMFAVSEMSSTPVVTVLLPVFTYLLVDALIYGLFAKTYLQDLQRNRSLEAVGERAIAFALSIWNMLCVSAVTLLSDGGYGVMYTMFVLFSLWFKIADLYQYTRYDKESKGVAKLAFPVLFFLLTVIVVFYKRLFLFIINSFVEEYAWMTVIIACVVLLLITACVLLVLDEDHKSVWAYVRKHYMAISLILVVFAITMTLGVILGQEKISGSHMEYRSRVHMENAGNILFNRIHTQAEQDKFMQASLNDWILYEYQRVGEDIKTFGEQGNGYFKLQPQSKLGAMWFAQTTDICISRYIIAEHGKTLAWLFVAAFALFLFITLRSASGYRWSRIVSVQIALLFAVQALMILLANTRAFIFFGQDFPLISITSRLSSLYFFMLMMLCVFSTLLGRTKYLIDFNDNIQLDGKLHKKNVSLCNNIMMFFIVASIALYILGKSDKNVSDGRSSVPAKTEKTAAKQNKKLSEKELRELSEKKDDDDDKKWMDDVDFYKDGVYDVDTLLTVVNAELESIINPAFKHYQKNISGVPRLQRNMSGYVSEVMADKEYMDSAFYRCSDFTKKMLERYKESDSKDNSIRSLICIRNVRSFEFKKIKGQNRYKVIPKDTLEFCTSLDHFRYELPKKMSGRWDGHVVEVVKDNYPDSAYMSSGPGWSAVYIPERYTADNEPVQIVKAVNNSGFALVGVNALLQVKPHGVTAVNVSHRDFLIAGERLINRLPLDRYNYIARNILLNGKRTFVYPNGKKMFWAREYAALKMKELRYGDPDVELTISSELSNSLYDVYYSYVKSDEGSNDDRTVICADGDGRIRAMVDYRADPAFRLNPNDYKGITDVSEFLSVNREKGRTTESRFFGNFANNVLRRGPGSTQKPIVWSAVTSMYNTGWWDRLKLAPVPLFKNNADHTVRTADDTYYYFKKYAGHPIESQFKSRITDEGAEMALTLREYMYKSSNYYNSIMAYLGTYSASELSSAAGIFRDSRVYKGMTFSAKPSRKNYGTDAQYNRALRQYNADLERYEAAVNSFPTMFIDKASRKPVAFDRFLTPQMIQNTQALLPKGLSDNFGLKAVVSERISDRPYTYFNMSIRKGMTSDRQLNEYAVRSVAIGNNSAWNVSPRRMAEMYGRVVGLNKSYKLSLDAKEDEGKPYVTEHELFDIHNTWDDADEYQTVRKELLIGMSEVFSDSKYATAASLLLPGTKLGQKNGKDVHLALDDGTESSSPKLYIYGKTGTINGYWGDLNGEDHMLATIITDRPLSMCGADDLKNVKFYVIYQVDYCYRESGWKEVDKEVILKVLQSKAFKDYMGLK